MWAGERCTSAHPFRVSRRLPSRLETSVGRPRGRTAAYSWRCCRGKVGHRPRRSVCGERGKRLGLVPRPDHAGRVRAGSSSADRAGTWRSRRISPRPGKPVTWRRAAASSQRRYWDGRRSPVNTGVLWPEPEWAEVQVLRIQTKLHRWANGDPDRRVDDLFNLVYARDRTCGRPSGWCSSRSSRRTSNQALMASDRGAEPMTRSLRFNT